MQVSNALSPEDRRSPVDILRRFGAAYAARRVQKWTREERRARTAAAKARGRQS